MGRDLPDLFCGPQANFRSYPAYPWRCLITIWVAAAATYNTDEQLPPPETLKYSVVAQGLNKKKDKKFKKSHDIISVYEQTNKIRAKYFTTISHTKETRIVEHTDEAFFLYNNSIHV